MNDEPTCLPANSIIGFATNGVAIFSPFDENSNDLNDVDYGVNCQGRTAVGGIYYYARVPDECSTFTPDYRGHDPSRIYGVAIDGFPIYGPGQGDTKITNADLDACHGKMVDGQYRYYMTDEWPYVLGCFRGTPKQVTGAPAPSTVCKFACNKLVTSNNIFCHDDFPVISTTKNPDINQIKIGLTELEISKFSSRGILESNTMEMGFVNINIGQDSLTFSSNGIPDHYIRNYTNGSFHKLVRHNFTVSFPRFPEFLTQPRCIPSNDIIGFATNGVPIFSPFDAEGNDINANGTFDGCNGRTNEVGIYHYTQLSDCLYNTESGDNEIFGVALDGFPIYGPGNSNITNKDLDVCHGRLEPNGQYKYFVTKEFPYILGCFRGAPQDVEINGKTQTQSSSDCVYACNTNGTTPESDRTFCVNSQQYFLLYIIIGVAVFLSLILIVLLVFILVKCAQRKRSCCSYIRCFSCTDCFSCKEDDEESHYHL
ncbi:uncharacterized protein [Amphiura filiformis]|uniref:uncharacterized protein n=1 Tax=Amphiura filiformis TaxID=82378 RepID=UPI003B216EFA